MKPIFFNSGDNRLFGVIHHPELQNSNSKNVLICYPVGNEYMRSYYLLRQLALQLQKAGHTVLRFDWFGYGDSDGLAENGTVSIWIQNILDAAKKLTSLRDNPTPLYIIGFRFGATLAFKAASSLSNIDKLVLWEPLISGEKWLHSLNSLHQAFLNTISPAPKKFSTSEEFLGFPFSKLLQDEIRQIDLLRSTLPECNLVVLNSESDGDCASFSHQIIGDGKGVEIRSASQKHWSDPRSYDRVIMSSPSVSAIVKSLGGETNG